MQHQENILFRQDSNSQHTAIDTDHPMYDKQVIEKYLPELNTMEMNIDKFIKCFPDIIHKKYIGRELIKYIIKVSDL